MNSMKNSWRTDGDRWKDTAIGRSWMLLSLRDDVMLWTFKKLGNSGLRCSVLSRRERFQGIFQSQTSYWMCWTEQNGLRTTVASLSPRSCQNGKRTMATDAAGLTVPEESRCLSITHSFVLIMHGLDYKTLPCGHTGTYIIYKYIPQQCEHFWKKIFWWKTLTTSILPTGSVINHEEKERADSLILLPQTRRKSVIFEGRMRPCLTWKSSPQLLSLL